MASRTGPDYERQSNMLASLDLLNIINNVSFCCFLKVPYYAKSLYQYFTITVICVFILSEGNKKSLCFLCFLRLCSCGNHPFVMSPNALLGSVCSSLLDCVIATSFWTPSKHLNESNRDFFFPSNNGVRPRIKNKGKIKIGRTQEVLKEKHKTVLCTI